MLRGAIPVYAATVFEDAVDELSILGSIMPYSYESKLESEKLVSDEISDIIQSQKEIEDRYEQAMLARTGVMGGLPSDILAAQQEIAQASSQLKSSTHVLSRTMMQNPLTPDNLEKVQEDRNFLEQVLRIAFKELLENGSYDSLNESVESENQKKKDLQEILVREEGSRKRIKDLKKQIEEVTKEKEVEVQARTEMIAHLKDQYQEMKAKTNMESKYIEKCCEVSVAQSLKKCTLHEKDLKNEIDSLRKAIDQEQRVNAESESWLRTHQERLETELKTWNGKYNEHVAELQHKLDVLKQSKAKDLHRLEELTRTYKEYEAVVIEDRIEKEKERRKKEQERIELENALKIQSWFRTVMVQKSLGPFGKKKKKGKKGKKGKKSGKKGKKKK